MLTIIQNVTSKQIYYGPQVLSYGQVYPQPLYVDVPATPYNTFRTADCMSTGSYCSNQEVCCTKTCKIAKGKKGRVCCLPEGNFCDYRPGGNPGLGLCCAGLDCLPFQKDKHGVGDPQITVCQVPFGGALAGARQCYGAFMGCGGMKNCC